jgi:hypothetical protein
VGGGRARRGVVVVKFVERVVQRQFVRQQFGQFLRVEFGEFERIVQQFVVVEFVEQFVGLVEFFVVAQFLGQFVVVEFVRVVVVEFFGQQLVVVLG